MDESKLTFDLSTTKKSPRMKCCRLTSSPPNEREQLLSMYTPPSWGCLPSAARILARRNRAAATGETRYLVDLLKAAFTASSVRSAAFAPWRYSHAEMSSEHCTQAFLMRRASCRALLRDGVSLPPTTALRPSAWYSLTLSASTYHVGVTPAFLKAASTTARSLTPSGVLVRRAETTAKWNSSFLGRFLLSFAERTLKKDLSVSLPA
mmetsp:Transcript_58642/g.172067  ORF Transcript_58642/g.172067 Transcript_58642/m.172067 type:complete len:207 (+) Transcript_58642:310-930(+)